MARKLEHGKTLSQCRYQSEFSLELEQRKALSQCRYLDQRALTDQDGEEVLCLTRDRVTVSSIPASGIDFLPSVTSEHDWDVLPSVTRRQEQPSLCNTTGTFFPM